MGGITTVIMTGITGMVAGMKETIGAGMELLIVTGATHDRTGETGSGIEIN
jgi:hypothetical protein